MQQLASRAGAIPRVIEMPGATSSNLFRLDFGDRREVLRVFRAERWDIPAADLSRTEIRLLEAVSDIPLPTPLPLGSLEDNGVIMSWLPGRVVLPALPDAQWLKTLAATLADIHRSSIVVPYAYETWNGTGPDDRPDWWQDQNLWNSAQALTATMPSFEPIFIHRDYHPVNVLWEGEQISGIVDWINACMGPQGIDVAHCRLNLAIMYGLDCADAFLAAYQAAMPGYRHDSYWDLDDALGALPDVKPYAPWSEFGLTNLSTETVRERLQVFIGAAAGF